MERAPYDVGIRDVVGDGPDRRQQASPAGASHRDPSIGLEQARGQRAVAFDQEGIEAEDLHFLRRLRAGARLPDVIELAPLLRAGIVERIALCVEMRFADERRHERDGEERDEPRRVHNQPRGEARDGDQVLRLAEELPDQVRASGRLPPRAFQPVLQLAVLEILEVERGGMLHEPKAGLVAEPLRQQRVEQGHGATEHVGEDGKSEFQDEQPSDAVEHAARDPLPQVAGGGRRLDEQHHLIDDELAHVERRDRQQCAHDPQQGLTERERRAGPPDERQERREVAQCAQALPPGLVTRRRRGITGHGGGCSPAHRVDFCHASLCRNVAKRTGLRRHRAQSSDEGCADPSGHQGDG